jgi:hypothetical protein
LNAPLGLCRQSVADASEIFGAGAVMNKIAVIYMVIFVLVMCTAFIDTRLFYGGWIAAMIYSVIVFVYERKKGVRIFSSEEIFGKRDGE